MGIKLNKGINSSKNEYIDIYKAINLIKENIDFTLEKIEINIKDSVGYILAEDVISKIDNPPFNNSAMDGIAIKYEDLNKNNIFKILTLIKTQKFNNSKIFKDNNEYPHCVEVSTGAIIPEPFDTVIPYENLEFINNKLVKIKETTKIKKYQNVRFKGEDFKANELILNKGTLINPLNLSILAFNGIKKVKVHKKAIISLIPPGNEIVDLNSKIKLGQIYNSNKYSILSYIKKYAKTGLIKHTKDLINQIKQILYKALEISDIVITVGGISKGKYDLINEILEKINTNIIFKKLKVKAGKPTTFSIYKTKNNKKVLIFSLLGNPISSLFNFNKLVIPAIYKLQNYNYVPILAKAKLEEDIKLKKSDDRLIIFPTYCYLKTNEYFIKPVNNWGSHTIRYKYC
jgi:molybdopterin molybdotransferase